MSAEEFCPKLMKMYQSVAMSQRTEMQKYALLNKCKR